MFSTKKFMTAGSQKPAYFRLGDNWTSDFILRLDDPLKIQAARLEVANPARHVNGIIVKERACWNPNYGYHFDPDTVGLAELSPEVCDAAFWYVDEHLADAGGAFLPGLRFCPWACRFVEEVHPPCV